LLLCQWLSYHGRRTFLLKWVPSLAMSWKTKLASGSSCFELFSPTSEWKQSATGSCYLPIFQLCNLLLDKTWHICLFVSPSLYLFNVSLVTGLSAAGDNNFILLHCCRCCPCCPCCCSCCSSRCCSCSCCCCCPTPFAFLIVAGNSGSTSLGPVETNSVLRFHCILWCPWGQPIGQAHRRVISCQAT